MKDKGKKIFKFIGIVLCCSFVLGAFANLFGLNLLEKFEKEEKDPYTLYAKNAHVEEGAITVDGVIDDAYVLLNKTPLNKIMISDQIKGASGAIYASESQENLSKTSDIQYYIAQSETKIYFMIRDFGTKWGSSRSEVLMRNNYYFRIGVNMNDYSQAIAFNLGAAQSEVKFLSISDAENVYTSTYDNVITSSAITKYKYDENTKEETLVFNSNNNADFFRYVAYIEIEFDKAALLESFNETFGIELKDFCNEFYIATFLKPYHWTGNTGDGNASFGYPLYAKILTDEELSEINGTTKVMPYKVIFE